MSTHSIVIVGASLAGLKAAETLRQQGYDGRVALIGDEPERPYQRPPLSKGWLAGTADLDDVYLKDTEWYADNGIELRTSTRVVGLEVDAHKVELADGSFVGYDQLLLATGSQPRRLNLPGANLAGVHYLRTLADAERLKAAAAAASSVAVIGAGWIGAEVAASLRQLGLPVALLDVAPVPLHRVLGDKVGSVYHDLHTANGVTMLMGTGIATLRGDNGVQEVWTTDGRTIAADLVVVGVGAAPRTELASAAGLTVDDGIVVDAQLRTSAPDVYAAGDVARTWHPLYGEHLRVEHWANALNQGVTAAASMIGDDVSYDRIPYFFSDQFDLGMEYSGHAPAWDRVIVRGSLPDREFIAFWVLNGVVMAAMNANTWDVTPTLQQLIRSRALVEPRLLSDPSVELAALVGAPAGASAPSA